MDFSIDEREVKESEEVNGARSPHPRVFVPKSSQAVEKKGRRKAKERKERTRVRKRMKRRDLPAETPIASERRRERDGAYSPTPQGNADSFERKGVAGKAIRKAMKTKGEEIPGWRRGKGAGARPAGWSARFTSF